MSWSVTLEAEADVAESERSRMTVGRTSNSEPAEVAAMLAVGVTTTDEGLDMEDGRSLPSTSA
jgi:hypothetical protein